ncbi:MAG TPA: hypothetical protein VGL93_31025 [Streptosporangiaceae bacterium]|jgi:hypothetical protein
MAQNSREAPALPEAVRGEADLDRADALVRELARNDGMSAWYAGLIDGMGWTRAGRRLRSPVGHEPTEGAAPDPAAIDAEIAACDDALAGVTKPGTPLEWVAAVRGALLWVVGTYAELPLEPEPSVTSLLDGLGEGP